MDVINRNAELFISIGESKNLGGYGTDAVSALVGFCFAHLNYHRIYVNVFTSNLRAIKCYEKAGSKYEGTLKEAHFENGKYEDVIVMEIISSP